MHPQPTPPHPPGGVPQTSGLAIASLVTGLTCLSPLAIIFGHVSLSKIKKSAGTLKGEGMAIAGLILGYVTLVLNVVFVIPVVLFSGAKAWKEGADRSACIMNQRNIEQMIQGYANLYNVEVGDSLDLDEIKEEFDMQHMNDACPMGGTLTISSTYLGPNESHVSCSKEDHKFNYDFSP